MVDRWQEAFEAFQDLCDLSEAEGTSKLEALRAEDPELAALVERLLAADRDTSEPGKVTEFLTTGLFDDFLEGAVDEEVVLDFLRSQREKGRRREIYGKGKVLGRGGVGEVVEVLDVDLGRPLAMKVLRTDGTRKTSAFELQRFLQEARVTALLDHPGVVPLHEIGADDEDRPYFTMKLVEGQTLAAILEEVHRGGSWTLTRVLNVLLRVSDAVAFAHSRGVVHCDLKPSNIMVGEFGEVFVMDWGAALLLARGDGSRALGRTDGTTPVADDGTVLGTPGYMAPEQASGSKSEIGPAADVYAIGAMLYHLLTGNAPYRKGAKGASARELLDRIRNGPPDRIRQLSPSAPSELVAICEKAMAYDRRKRYSSMGALRAEIQAFLERRVVKTYESGVRAELKKWVARNPLLAGAAGLLVVALSAGAIGIGQVRAAADEEAKLADDWPWAFEFERMAHEELWPISQATAPRLERWLQDVDELAQSLEAHEQRLLRLEDAARQAPADEDALFALQRQRVLVKKLKEFRAGKAGVVASVRDRLDHLLTVEERTISGPDAAAKWEAARASIANKSECPAYAGLDLPPQLGLLPLGRNAFGLWEFAHLLTGSVPDWDEDAREARLREGNGLVFILVPGGTYATGCQGVFDDLPNFDFNCEDDEEVHDVDLKAFFLSKFELTQDQWLRITGENPATYAPPGYGSSLLHPVEFVSWTECDVWLRARLGLDLPTEPQWEAAARAGTETTWWTGTSPQSLEGRVSLGDSSIRGLVPQTESWDDGYEAHCPVGEFDPNHWGFYNMSGNVWEWCRDWYGIYDLPVSEDGERLNTEERYKVARGGCHLDIGISLRIAHRGMNLPKTKNAGIGVRPSRRVFR